MEKILEREMTNGLATACLVSVNKASLCSSLKYTLVSSINKKSELNIGLRKYVTPTRIRSPEKVMIATLCILLMCNNRVQVVLVK